MFKKFDDFTETNEAFDWRDYEDLDFSGMRVEMSIQDLIDRLTVDLKADITDPKEQKAALAAAKKLLISEIKAWKL